MAALDDWSPERRGSSLGPAGDLAAFGLVGALRSRAALHPDKRLFTFLADGENESAHLTYGGLDRRARAIAARLQEAGLAGERGLLLFPPGLGFVEAFFGCLYAGVVAVPAYPPRAGGRLQRLSSLLDDARPAVVLADSSLLSRAEGIARRLPAAHSLPWIAVESVDDGWAASWRQGPHESGDLAFLQYTSGSTATPKGIMVTHGNLQHNQEMMREAFAQTPESVVVGWLPLYHDMGLIGTVLNPIWAGASCVLMPPLAFLQRPARWLEAISRFGATTSGGPNFAYDLCVRRVDEAEKQGLDLSAWRVAFSGAEPVRSETLERFAAAFAPQGFRREAFYPCYGLAEATLFVSGGELGDPPVTAAFDAAGLEAHRVAPPADGGLARALVGCGHAWSGQRLAVADPATGTPCPAGRVGEIWVAGPSVAAGYWQRPEESAATFGARLNGDGPFLRTGDLGFVRGGQVFITGRLKDLIILRGRNLYPQDVELTVERSHPALRLGGGAAFAVEGADGERLVVVQEIERHRRAEAPQALEAARRAIAEEHEVRVHEVVLVRPGAVPKTTSGKVRRGECRAAWRAGSLEVVARAALPEGEAVLEPAVLLDRGSLLALEPAARAPLLAAWLAGEAARLARLGDTPVASGDRLTDLGFDSLLSAELKHRLEELLEVTVPLALLAEGPTIASLAASLAAALEAAPVPRPAGVAVGGGDRPLSAGQKALWLAHELAPASGVLNLAGAAAAPPSFDPEALRRACQALVDRHPSLRTGFHAAQGEPRQRVREAEEVDFAADAAGGRSVAELATALEAEAWRPFDLERDRLLRVRAFRAADGSWRLLFGIHHLVADFWSIAVLMRELGPLYAQASGGAPAALPPPGRAYADWVHWQEAELAGGRQEQLWEGWRRSLEGAPAALNLPADRPLPPVPGHAGGAVALLLEAGTAGRLRAVARERGATLFMVLLAAFQALLHRQSGQDDLVVGSPAAGRSEAEWRDTVGYFVNPLPLRACFAGAPSFGELLDQVRRTALDAFAGQDFPFLLLAERLQPRRDPGRPALFQVMFVFQKAQSVGQEALAAFTLGTAGMGIDLGEMRLEVVPLAGRRVQLDLTLTAAELDGGVEATLEYAADLFDPATAGRLAAQLTALLAAAESACPVADLPALSPAARHQVACEWSVSAPVSAGGECLHDLVNAQAARTPEAVAVQAGSLVATYAEMRRMARGLAAELRRMGVGPEVRVGVHLDRSIELVVGLLGILEAGGAYVPLDLGLPAARLGFMIADAGVLVVLARASRPLERPGLRQVFLDAEALASFAAADPPPVSAMSAAVPGNLAYLIYTSGSTGRPKGVAIEHRSAAVLVGWAREEFAPEELAAVLASTSISFDLSVFELFVPLSVGGRVVLAEDALRVPADAAVTLFNTVPSVMAELLRAGPLPASVRAVNLAGEPLPGALAVELYTQPGVARVRNLYGPSEDTTYSTCGVAEREGERQPTIGRPVAGARVHLLDAGGQPVPPGVPGELFLGGEGLARGYWARPELTAERFVPEPFAAVPGSRLYRTGDLARYRPDGRLDFLGRLDQQVKVRGFRIEPGEIEAALAAHPAVREAVVLAREDAPGERRLVAYVVAAQGQAPTAAELREWLGERLPPSMVPSAFVPLEALPLNPNGKLDRAALPAPAAPAAPADGVGGAAAPRTPVEEVLAGLWTEVLGAGQVGLHDDFFDLGGHSLLAARVVARVRSALGVELSLAALFERPTVARLAAWVEEARRAALGVAVPPLERASRAPRAPEEGAAPASFAQRRLWFLDQLEPGNPAYNVPLAVRLSGRLEASALASALSAVAGRHEALRTTFAAEGGEPVQVIAPALPVPLPVADLAGLPAAVGEEEAAALAREEARLPFDLARGPLLRTTLLRLGGDEHLLLLTLHHAVADGWSLGVLLGEVAALYGAALRGEAGALPELPIQYADYALWQRRWLAGGSLRGQLDYWRQRLADAAPLLALPADRPRPPAQTWRGARRHFATPPAAAAALAALARRERATPFMVLLAAFQALLARYTGQSDVSVGTPVAGRVAVETEGLIGVFVNTLVLRTDLSGDPSFAGLVARAREVALAAYLHQDLPFERLVEELRPERSLAHSALFQVLLVLQNTPLPAFELPGLALRPVEIDPGAVKLDLSLDLTLTAAGLAGRLAYNGDLFQATTADRLVRHFLNLLADAVAHPELPLGDLALLDAAEREQLLAAARAPWPEGETAPVHELFARQARRAPQAPAVIGGGERLSRGEVSRRAGRLARRLRRLGVGPEVTVALLAERSPATVVGILAVHAAGGAYVPVEPDLPAERLAFVLADARVAAVLASAALAGRVPPGYPLVLLEAGLEADGEEVGAQGVEEPAAVMPESLAYVIYTSGSTGRPKGVAVEHRQLAAYTHGVIERLGLEECASFAVVSTFAADLGHTAVFPALATGGCLHVLDAGTAGDGDAFAAYLERHAIDALKIVPSHLAALQAVERSAGGWPRRRLILGGEAATWKEVDRYCLLAPGCRVFNHYGPTEATVGVLACEAAAGERAAAAGPPLGRPLPGAEAYVLDELLRPLPPGAPGELWVGGAGLARGYLGRPELTAERFVPHPFSPAPGARLYRTGDLARRRADGAVEFLGRFDRQVKVRGFRVELREVAAALERHPAVRSAVVTADGQRLAAYLVAADGGRPAGAEVAAFLRASLPDFMVPAAFVWLEAIPRTANGKVDERALPEPWGGEPAAARAPRSPVEELLAGLFAEVLGTDRVGIDDDFFALGGHSLLATRLVSRLRRTLRADLPLRALFDAPTVAALALRIAALRGAGEAPLDSIPRLEARDGAPLSFAQERLWFLDQLDPGRATYNLPYFARVDGPLDVGALHGALAGVVGRHEALRTRFPLEDGRPVQRIAPRQELALPLVDLAALPAGHRADEARRLAGEEGARPFDLATGPLLRALLLRHGAADHTLLLNLHHIASDAWSRGVLTAEVAAGYGARIAGPVSPASPLPPLSIQYADFAVWQRRWVQEEVLPRELPYWLERLGGDLEPLQLPTDRPRPPVRSSRGGYEAFVLPAATAAGVRALARREGASPFMVLLAGFAALLRRYSGQRDLVVGSPIANRNRAEIEPLIGFFANTLALRLDLAGDPPFAEAVARARESALGAYDHQDLPFERLVEAVAGSRDTNRGPLVEAVFLLQNAPMPPLEFRGLTWTPLEAHNGTAKFDLVLSLTETDGGLAGTLVYDADLFDAATARRLHGYFATLVDGALATPETSVARLPLLTGAERRQLLADSVEGGADPSGGPWVHERFAAQAARAPEAAAVIAPGETLSYAELARRAERLGDWLRGQGIGAGSTVGICLRNSPAMVVAVLGVLRAGAAYVPMDPGHPPARLSYIAADAGLVLWLSDRELAPGLPRGETPVLDLESDWERVEAAGATAPAPPAAGASLAYVIYTSGSTGQPKGVAVSHASLLNYVLWAAAAYFPEPGLAVPLYSSLSFDLTVTSVFPPLVTGNAIRVYRDPGRGAVLEEIFRGGEVDVVKLTPSHLALIEGLDHRGCRVRRLVVGGEALERELAQRVWERFGGVVEIYNEYGPTEATVGCMIHLYDPRRDRRAAVPVGRPGAGTGIHVLDSHLEPVPPNVVGELCIAGRGLAQGYRNRPDLTAAAFVPHPFAAGERLYRSGDLARRLSDGRVEFLGRRDEQVKFHGFRIELDEIRGALERHGEVRDSVVQVRRDAQGNDLLVAYYVSRRELDVAGLRAFLAASLQEEMIPNLFVHLRRLPLTLNGKVNHQALPGVEEVRRKLASAGSGGRAVRRPAEELLAGIWSEVLGVPEIGLKDNFFELGGHSLLGTQVVSRVREAFGVDLPLRAIFEQPTVEGLAARVEEEARAGGHGAVLPIVAVPRDGGLPLSFAQQRLLFLDRLQPGSPLYNVPGALRVEGELDEAALRRALAGVVRRHESLRTRFVDAGGETVQAIDPPGEPDFAVVDLTALPAAQRGDEAGRLAVEEARQPFDLAASAPLRVRLLRGGERERTLLLTMHHAASDGWSMALLIRELGALYEAAVAGRPAALPEPAVQYADFACWQRRVLDGERLEAQLAYWRRHLEGAPALFELPTDRPRPAVQTYRGDSVPWEVPSGLRPSLEALARREGATLFMVLLAAFEVLLGWFSGRDDFVVGTDVANRNRLETEGVIGFFVNQLPLRARLAGLATFREVLAQARETTLGAYLHQDAPFEKVVESLRLERSLAHSPLLQVKVNLHNFQVPALELPGLVLRPIELPTGTAKLDLTFDIFAVGRELTGFCQYRTDLFAAGTARRLLRLYGLLLERLAAEPGAALGALAQLFDNADRAEESLARARFRTRRGTALQTRVRKPVEQQPLEEGG